MGFTSVNEEPLKFVFHEKATIFSTSFNIDRHTLARGFSEILSAFIKLVESRLSRKQKCLLLLADEFLRYENMSLNSLVEKCPKN